ncbi:MAG: hypothetical protein HYU33_07805, partial [Candidatus Omnitrophica bacterium]|nr:hypothetical protein [Candidatus Omnitrophota bacterium]
MKRMAAVFIGMMVLISPTIAWTQEEHQHQHSHEASMPKEETLTGEVMDVFCYLSHKEQGQGKDHASCAKKCIQSGLPVAIKVGNQLYLATMAD